MIIPKEVIDAVTKDNEEMSVDDALSTLLAAMNKETSVTSNPVSDYRVDEDVPDDALSQLVMKMNERKEN